MDDVYVNDLKVSIDWLSFTCFDFNNAYEFGSWLGLAPDTFTHYTKGARGYRQKLVHHSGITILYDGNDGMGIHCDCSGSCVPVLLDSFKTRYTFETPFGEALDVEKMEYNDYVMKFFDYITTRGNVTRIDLALDDHGSRYYTVDAVYKLALKNCIATLWKSFDYHDSKYIDGTPKGATLYFGSRTSQLYLRIYDKQLEQLTKVGHFENDDQPWTRWELEFKDGNANNLAIRLAGNTEDRHTLGELAIDVLNRYFRIIERTDSNTSRCKSDPLWEAFVKNAASVSLTPGRAASSIEKKRRWIHDDVLPSIAAVYVADECDFSFIGEDLHTALLKNNKMIMDEVISKNPLAVNFLS